MAWEAVASTVLPELIGGGVAAEAAGSFGLSELGQLGGIAQGLGGAAASMYGANQAAGAANNAVATQAAMFNTQNQQQEPYRQAGYKALSQLAGGFRQGQVFTDTTGAILGTPGGAWKYGPTGWTDMGGVQVQPNDAAKIQAAAQGPGALADQFTHQFDANDLKTNLAPNYQFMLDQGLGATRAANNVTNSFQSGNTGKALVDYAENYAGNAYQAAFQNYNTNQTNIYNRLANIAGLGQTANAQSSQLAGTVAPSIANAQIAGGQAQAAGTMGAANALSQGANSALGWYALPQLMSA